MKYKLQLEPEAVYEKVIASVTRARQWTDDVEWSAEDGTRTVEIEMDAREAWKETRQRLGIFLKLADCIKGQP
jgi:isopropylmalate/homocitrate/citramalate synthase